MRRWIEAGILTAAMIGMSSACSDSDSGNPQTDTPNLSPTAESDANGEFRSKYLGYTLKYPVNWIATTQSEGYSYVDIFKLNKEDYNSSLILISVIPFEKEMSLDDYAESAIGIGLSEPKDGPEIDGVESKIIDVYEIMGEKSQMIIFVKNGVAYNIEYFAPTEELEITKNVLNGMLSSFHVIAPPATPSSDLESALTY